jgi:hypothetical protein
MSLNKSDAIHAAGTGVPHVVQGIQPLDSSASGFGSAGDFPQDTQAHFKGLCSTMAHDDALGGDYDHD